MWRDPALYVNNNLVSFTKGVKAVSEVIEH